MRSLIQFSFENIPLPRGFNAGDVVQLAKSFTSMLGEKAIIISGPEKVHSDEELAYQVDFPEATINLPSVDDKDAFTLVQVENCAYIKEILKKNYPKIY